MKISYNWAIFFKQILSISVNSFCYRVHLVSFISQIIFFISTISILEETPSPIAMPSEDRSSRQHLEWTLPETMCLVTQSCLTICDPMDCRGLLFAWEFFRPEYWGGSPFPSPGDLCNPGLNPGLLHCRWILYQLSHQRSPRILEWIAYPFSSGSSQPRNQTGVSYIAGGFCTNWTIREIPLLNYLTLVKA